MFEKLLEPANIGDLSLKNRIVMAPIESRLAEDDGTAGDRLIGYYAARARGGVGLVIVE
ncbi:MAG: hypothetical protein Q7O66_18615, partial [Dehalococcoidia bacterium]|nr:hypothetical protein [Dehalococcoidia bacterium]